MYVCKSCGRVLDDDDLIDEAMYVSDYMGRCYEKEKNCPCGGTVTEAKRCAECGEYFDEDELYGGMCGECLHKEMTIDNALSAGDSAKEYVSINGFLAEYFEEGEIEEILIRELERRAEDDITIGTLSEAAESWCEDDIRYFSDWIKSKKGVQKNDKRQNRFY